MSVGASRITYIPKVSKQLRLAALAGLTVPFLIGWFPSIMLTMAVWIFGSFSAACWTALVLAGSGFVIGLLFAVPWAYQQREEFRWIDLQPDRVVFKKVRGSLSVAQADLRTVHIVETIKLGRSIGCDIWFTTADSRFSVPKGISEPLMMPPAKLAAWFTERLDTATVEVTHESVVKRADLLIEDWYNRAQVAALWGVPIEDVDGLAARFRVPSQTYTPRIGMMHGVNHPRTVFDPDDVHLATAQVRSS